MNVTRKITAVLLILFLGFPAIAAEIKGKVVEVEASRAKIAYESDFAPRAGDKVQIGFEHGEDFIPVEGDWRIVKVTIDFLWAESKTADPGTPALNYLVVIQSDNPQKRSDLSSSEKKRPDDGKQIEKQQLIYIPSLNAKVTELRFFESGYGVSNFAQRVYKRQFPSSSSRYINWELNLKHPKPNQRIDFEITAIYYRPDDSILRKQTKKSYIKQNWTSSYHVLGWGSKKPGTWKVGTYRVDLFIKDQKVASGSFRID